jgi:L-rhamnose 1-dehydrogenase
MAKLLEGKVAAITGAVTGIGRAIVLEYLEQGASVAVNHYPDDRSEAQYQSLVEEASNNARLIAVSGDISKPETGQALVAKAVERFGRLDIFVSNAGVCQFADFLTCVASQCLGGPDN